jgi:hypothetical protein
MKEDTGGLFNLLDLELGGLVKLFEMLEYIRSNNKKGWSVKTEKLELR